MTHKLFGKLKYRERDEQWVGYAPLPCFASVGTRAQTPITEEDANRLLGDMNALLDNMRNELRDKYGSQVDAAFAKWDAEAAEAIPDDAFEDEPSPKQQEREQKRAERARKRAARLARGDFPVGIGAAINVPPSEKQEATFKFLVENEQMIFGAVLTELWDSFQGAYGQEYWRRMAGIKPAASVVELQGRFAITRVDLTRETRGGFAHLVFHIDSDWQDSHGLMVVYSPDTREIAWTAWDGLHELLESDDPAEQPEEFVPTPHDLLLEAILTGDETRARELVASGADINALHPQEYPPLWIAVDQIEVEEVRRLLAFGANPNLINEDEQTTPLQHAQALHRDLDPAELEKQDALLEGILSIGAEGAKQQFETLRTRLEQIMALLGK
jgi:hypothetical protein